MLHNSWQYIQFYIASQISRISEYLLRSWRTNIINAISTYIIGCNTIADVKGGKIGERTQVIKRISRIVFERDEILHISARIHRTDASYPLNNYWPT